MTDFDTFLTEALPFFGLSPAALRRRNIRRRVMKRMESQGIHDFRAYLSLLRRDPSEREELRPLLTVPISRFFRKRRVFVTLGFASWGEGQLESEITENSWLTVQADPKLIFETPVAERYDGAMALLGLQSWMLSPDAGHA